MAVETLLVRLTRRAYDGLRASEYVFFSEPLRISMKINGASSDERVEPRPA